MAFTPLDQPVQFLKAVGPRRAEALARLDVHLARDLLFHVPRRYEDASTVSRIGSLQLGGDATVIGEVLSKGVLPTRTGLRIFQLVLRDQSGSIECSFPGQPFLDRTFRRGDVVLVTGPIRFFHGKQLQPREYVILGHAGEGVEASGRVLPIYASTEGLSQKMLRSILDQNLDRLLPLLATEDAVPRELLEQAGLPSLMQAIAALHRPESVRDADRGRRRLAFDELLFLQLLHAHARRARDEEADGIAFRRTDTLIAPLYRALPFELTAAQQRALSEIFADMTSPRRMNRLLQGDVGSGKTIVALFAMLLAVESGYQAALMAPTEILAEQHARTMRTFLEPLGLAVTLLTGRLPASAKRQAHDAIAAGDASIVVGTHALIQEAVSFRRLGLAITDEQHRFGVRQRLALSEHAVDADVLVMSATPIPRSLALTLYGDLDFSMLDELPPDRQRIRTAVRAGSARDRVYDFIRHQAGMGRQAYIVYPLVEESAKIELRAATAEFERLARDVFPDLSLGLLHGQMAGDARDTVMRAFATGDIDIMVATTVIEVGIDVANATVMVIEHADRFGLSQLHQLRGRVGRGAERSYCILISDDGAERLQILARSHDGFEIARADLALRGMGDFFGARQHGLPDFRFFDPLRDEDLLIRARDAAQRLLDNDPQLRRTEHSALKAALARRFADRAALFGVG
ncbi:MAG TPA: ATP-dependent DNA helicase RecG [Longimicrobiales bacterium]|nr:ATP-dependent DNA helicase RecG [Longimicrobiales bacterium]